VHRVHKSVLNRFYDLAVELPRPLQETAESSGEATRTEDQPGQFDRYGIDEPQDVVEYWALD